MCVSSNHSGRVWNMVDEDFIIWHHYKEDIGHARTLLMVYASLAILSCELTQIEGTVPNLMLYL